MELARWLGRAWEGPGTCEWAVRGGPVALRWVVETRGLGGVQAAAAQAWRPA